MFNPELIEELKQFGANINNALTVLWVLDNKLEEGNKCVTDDDISYLSYLGLIKYDFEMKRYNLQIPLYQEDKQITLLKFDDDFIRRYISKFTKINKDRRASLESVKKRLISLITEYPSVTEEEILKSVDLHISRLRDPTYLKQADYFIWNRENGYYIMKYIEEIRENPDVNTSNFDLDDQI